MIHPCRELFRTKWQGTSFNKYPSPKDILNQHSTYLHTLSTTRHAPLLLALTVRLLRIVHQTLIRLAMVIRKRMTLDKVQTFFFK